MIQPSSEDQYPATCDQWKTLESADERIRFSEIMRLMDDRYDGLSPEQLDLWVARRNDVGKRAVLLGLFDSDARIKQVIAVTVRDASDSRVAQRAISMVGVASDELDHSQIDDEAIRDWLANIVLAAKQYFGCPTVYETMRPKTMTFKPMQRMHDFMTEGIVVRQPNAPDRTLKATVTESNDRGHTVFLRLRLEQLDCSAPAAPIT